MFSTNLAVLRTFYLVNNFPNLLVLSLEFNKSRLLCGN